MIQNTPLNSLQTSEIYGHIYNTLDNQEIHGIKKVPGSTPPSGSFATVKWARNLKTGALLARRICWINNPADSAKMQKLFRDSAERCISTFEKLRGMPGIVPYHGYAHYINKKGKEKFVFFFDKATQDVFSLLENAQDKPLDPKTQLSFAKQLLEVLHRLKGAHGDLKPENLLEKEGQLWLCDFDFYSEQTGPCLPATPVYTAPEILKTRKCLNLRKKDVWACGIILFFIFTNTFNDFFNSPFNPLEFSKVLEAKIANPQVRHLLSMMVEPDPAKRCTIDEAYDYFISYI